MNPFDFVNAISQTKKDIMTGNDNDELMENAYTPFIVNKALSYFPDTVMHANIINFHNFLDKKLQFHYHLNSIRPSKRFAKWVKKDDNEELELIMQYYGYNIEKARQVHSLLSTEQLSIIKTILTSGVE